MEAPPARTLVLFVVLLITGHEAVSATAADSIVAQYGEESFPATTLDQDELGDLVSALIDDVVERNRTLTAEPVSALLAEWDADNSSSINAAELTAMAPELLKMVLPLKAVGTVTIAMFQREYECSLVNASALDQDSHAGHDHRRRMLAEDDDHDEDDGHGHGDGHGHDDEDDNNRKREPPPPLVFMRKYPNNSTNATFFSCVKTKDMSLACSTSGDGHDHGDMAEEETEDLVPRKIGFLFLIFALGLIGGLTPMSLKGVFKSRPELKVYLGWANAFSGGVFLSAAFTHILPEAEAQFRKKMCVTAIDGQTVMYYVERMPYPIIPLLMMIGYILVLLVEKVMFSEFGMSKAMHDDGDHDDKKGHHQDLQLNDGQGKWTNGTEMQPPMSAQVGTPSQMGVYDQFAWQQPPAPQQLQGLSPDTPAMAQQFAPPAMPVAQQFAAPAQLDTVPVTFPGVPMPGNVGDDTDKAKKKADAMLGSNPLAPYLLLAALGLHSIFAGLALGVTKEMAELVSLVVAICAHKAVAALALGSSFLENGVSRKKAMPLLVFFSTITPVGVAIGIGIVSVNLNQTSAILQGLAVGTFVYVGASEVVPKEFEHCPTSSDRWIKFALFLVGAAAIALVGLNSHEH
mmetsp:Transcript_11672/g.26683  ORF Transcript_11672/g.26683 Transcript_11672/m.26683 type:complete len:629 (+) Transcript_11672:79-1965(+)